MAEELIVGLEVAVHEGVPEFVLDCEGVVEGVSVPLAVLEGVLELLYDLVDEGVTVCVAVLERDELQDPVDVGELVPVLLLDLVEVGVREFDEVGEDVRD